MTGLARYRGRVVATAWPLAIHARCISCLRNCGAAGAMCSALSFTGTCFAPGVANAFTCGCCEAGAGFLDGGPNANVLPRCNEWRADISNN